MPLFHTSAAASGHGHLILASFLERLIDAEARRALSRWEVLERREKLPDDGLRGHEQKRAVTLPFAVEQRGVLGGPFEWVTSQVVNIRGPFRDQRLLPHAKAVGALLHERALPVSDAQSHQVAVITPVEKSPSWILFDLALQERQQIVAVDVDLERLVSG